MLKNLVTSKARVKILMRLFLNPERKAYLRELASDFNMSPGLISEELKQMKKAGFLDSEKTGRQIFYQANQKHPLFNELNSMVKKTLGMDMIVEWIIKKLGNLESAYLIDDYAEGKDNGIIDLLLIGNIDQSNLLTFVSKAEKHINRKIRTITLSADEFSAMKNVFADKPKLLIWQRGERPPL